MATGTKIRRQAIASWCESAQPNKNQKNCVYMDHRSHQHSESDQPVNHLLFGSEVPDNSIPLLLFHLISARLVCELCPQLHLVPQTNIQDRSVNNFVQLGQRHQEHDFEHSLLHYYCSEWEQRKQRVGRILLD